MVRRQCQLPFPYELFPKPLPHVAAFKSRACTPKICNLIGALVVQSMIFLSLLYFCFFSGPFHTLALPTGSRPPEIPPKSHLQSIFVCEEDRFGSRSIYGILWSCLSTMFACTWITVHLNIPAPGDSQWAVLRRRLAIMGYFLLTPEFVIFWAARQHFVARYFTKKLEKNHPGWTRTHSFFLIMGGFTLHERGKPVRVLEVKDLEELSEAGKIKWPTVTKEEIADRSKGDYLSKTIVILQTTWFIGQCIARGAYHLAVTELEVVTVAFASLTGVIYYLWWDKPLDVRCSIPVDLLPDRLWKIEGNIDNEETGLQIIPSPEIFDEEIDENVVVNPNPLPTTSNHVDTSTPDPAPTRMEQFRAFIRGACEEHGTLFALGYVFIGFPLKQFISPLSDMANCETLRGESLRVPTFYSPDSGNDPGDDNPFALALWVASVFGAVHCIPWSFHFATLQEQWVWRISAILASGLPISMAAIALLVEKDTLTWSKICEDFMILSLMVMALLYFIARIALLVLPFIALRGLPPRAYVQLNWVSFLPHI